MVETGSPAIQLPGSSLSVREEYKNPVPYSNVVQAVDDHTEYLLEKVLARYAGRSSWSLSRLSHDEVSWKHAREGLRPDDNGNVPMSEKMMRVDAVREKAQRKYNEKAFWARYKKDSETT